MKKSQLLKRADVLIFSNNIDVSFASLFRGFG
jgi:hypothetical protein